MLKEGVPEKTALAARLRLPEGPPAARREQTCPASGLLSKLLTEHRESATWSWKHVWGLWAQQGT